MNALGEKTVRILVAEDNNSNYLLLYTLLKREYELAHACNGVEAVEMHKTFCPGIILMDIKMPEMDGYTATRRIRESDKEVPIIAVTAYAFDQDRERALEAGCNDYMTKPISQKLLRELIQKWAPKR